MSLICRRNSLKPALLVTCRVGKRVWCREEIGDALFPLDNNIEVYETGFPDLLLVCSGINPRVLYNRAKNREYGFVENIIPVDSILPGLDYLESAVDGVVIPGERLKIRVKAYGVRGLSSQVWDRVASVLKGKSAIIDKESDTCLYILLFEKNIVLGKGLCKAVFKPSII
ncbi:RNA-binding protein [Thermogladius sp. 4427co]|uniref:RNA-binding protein n=1 Tax=Thermogladius sp. 4427co TaxID=3450718 RepID=UPI003F7A6E43